MYTYSLVTSGVASARSDQLHPQITTQTHAAVPTLITRAPQSPRPQPGRREYDLLLDRAQHASQTHTAVSTFIIRESQSPRPNQGGVSMIYCCIEHAMPPKLTLLFQHSSRECQSPRPQLGWREYDLLLYRARHVSQTHIAVSTFITRTPVTSPPTREA